MLQRLAQAGAVSLGSFLCGASAAAGDEQPVADDILSFTCDGTDITSATAVSHTYRVAIEPNRKIIKIDEKRLQLTISPDYYKGSATEHYEGHFGFDRGSGNSYYDININKSTGEFEYTISHSGQYNYVYYYSHSKFTGVCKR